MKLRSEEGSRTGFTILGVAMLLGAGLVTPAARAQLMCPNSCTANVVGPRDGRHSFLDMSADSVLWPPNHKLRTITISATNTNAKECNVTITDARQDEAIDDAGSGNTSPDAANCNNSGNTSTIDLRSERTGGGTGRYYHVSFTMDDPDCPMQPTMDEAKVLVPHDQGINTVSLDEGPGAPSYEGMALSCQQ